MNKTYEEIVIVISTYLINDNSKKGFTYMSGFVKGMKESKKPIQEIKFYTRLKSLIEEGCSIKQIIDELDMLNPEFWGRTQLSRWSYPKNINIIRIKDRVDKAFDLFGEKLSKEEISFFFMVNYEAALKIRMEK